VEVTVLLQDLAALAPSAIVCVAFLVGAAMLLRHELAPKRRARAEADGDGDGEPGNQSASERDERTES
jgi:hypothetical protein